MYIHIHMFQSKLEGFMQNLSTENVEKTFESIFGKEKLGRVRCYGRTVTPSLFKINQEIVAIKKGYDMKIDGMAKRIEGLETMMTLILKQQNPDLNDDNIEHMMSLAFGKENSSIAPRSSASTRGLCFDQV